MKRLSVIASDATFKYFLFEVERPLLHVSQCPVFFTGRGCNTYNKLAKRVFNSDADLLKENRPLLRGDCRGVFMRNQWIEYNPRLKQIARKLRKDMTLSEILLWQHIKGKQLLGYDFHRQKPINEYVVDFYCPRLKLILEIDGDSHEGKEEADKIRQEKLELLGLTVMRFWDWDVKSNIDGIVEYLREWIEAHRTHP